MFGVVMLSALALFVVYGIFFTDYFIYKTIRVEGTISVAKDAVYSSSSRLLLFQNPKITLPAIASWHLERNLWQRELVIHVKERERFAVWCSMTNASAPPSGAEGASTSTPIIIAQDCFWFDRTGFMFEETPQTIGVLIKSVRDFSSRPLTIGSYPLAAYALENLFKIFEVTDRAGIAVVTFDLFSLEQQELIGESQAGARLEFSLRNDPGYAIEPLSSLVPQLPTLQYIDLRSENKVFYK